MGITSLPAEGRRLVESCEPHADQLLGYWDDILHNPNQVVDAARRADLRAIADRGIDYHWVASAEPSQPYEQWLKVTVLPGGHFPHLEHPAALAELLAGTR
jgi:pimeloyl-ACP methyl ester carboxylesterase